MLRDDVLALNVRRACAGTRSPAQRSSIDSVLSCTPASPSPCSCRVRRHARPRSPARTSTRASSAQRPSPRPAARVVSVREPTAAVPIASTAQSVADRALRFIDGPSTFKGGSCRSRDRPLPIASRTRAGLSRARARGLCSRCGDFSFGSCPDVVAWHEQSDKTQSNVHVRCRSVREKSFARHRGPLSEATDRPVLPRQTCLTQTKFYARERSGLQISKYGVKQETAAEMWRAS